MHVADLGGNRPLLAGEDVCAQGKLRREVYVRGERRNFRGGKQQATAQFRIGSETPLGGEVPSGQQGIETGSIHGFISLRRYTWRRKDLYTHQRLNGLLKHQREGNNISAN